MQEVAYVVKMAWRRSYFIMFLKVDCVNMVNLVEKNKPGTGLVLKLAMC